AAGVDDALLARVERVAVRAELDAELRLGRVGLERVAAGAVDGRLDPLRVDAFFHGRTFLRTWTPAWYGRRLLGRWLLGGGAGRGRGRGDRVDADLLAVGLLPPLELDLPVDQGVDRVVLAHPDVAAEAELRAALADDDVAGADELAAELLDAEALRVRVAPVARGADAFLVSHSNTPDGELLFRGPRAPLRPGDLVDDEPGVVLAVAGPLAVAHLRLVLEDDHLLAFGVRVGHRRADHGAGDQGRADDGGLVVVDREHLVELDLRARLARARQLLDEHGVADPDLVLLPAGLHDRVRH